LGVGLALAILTTIYQKLLRVAPFYANHCAQ